MIVSHPVVRVAAFARSAVPVYACRVVGALTIRRLAEGPRGRLARAAFEREGRRSISTEAP